MSEEGPKRGGVQSLQRAIDILDMVSEAGAKGVRLSDAASVIGVGKSTVHRMLAELVRGGLVEQDERSKLYRVGAKLIRFGERAARSRSISDLVQPALERLAEATADTVYLSVRSGNSFICMAREVGTYPVKVLSLEPGERRPLGLGAGSLVLLAFLCAEERERIIAANAAKAPDNDALAGEEVRRCVGEVLRAGYARTEGRVVKGIAAIAVPIFDGHGVVGSLSLQAISSRLSARRTAVLLGLLAREAIGVSLEMGASADATARLEKLSSVGSAASRPEGGKDALIEDFA